VSDPEPDYKAKYFELLFAVGLKHAGESRHETALRYIRQAEEPSNEAVAAKPADWTEDAHGYTVLKP
jgi:hypothetical protein